MKCPSCGGPRERGDRYCVYCGTSFDSMESGGESRREIHIHYHQENRPEPRYQVEHIYVSREQRSDRSRLVALLLCLFLGVFGAHRFYLGKFGTGLLYLLTEGLFAVGWLVDLCVLIFGTPRDKKGLKLTW